MFCYILTKNSNCEISIKNLGIFKREEGVKDEKVQ